MAGKIPRDFIDNLIARVDLVDLIDSRVPLKKAGKNYQARCPFHSEKSPSFSVNREKQFYHCFGCGASGNAISFLMDYERQSFVEAVETLADTVGIPVPREAYSGDKQKQESNILPLYQVQEQAAEFYARQLREHPEAARARDYLSRRGLSGDIIQRFQIGYAPPGWRSLPLAWSNDSLLASGLAIANEGGNVYDRFRDRVMFPIRDRRGRVVGFGGRVLTDEKPKYLNSPETPTFKKHLEVYGLYELLATRQKIERIVVVEGYMDVIALAQHDIPYAVATLGTATSSDHANLLFRYTGELVFCFDGDTAGQNAAWKALEASLPALRDGRAIRFLMLPQEHDPDSLVREEGKPGFEQRLAQAMPLSDYLFQHLSGNLDLGSTEGKAALFNSATPLIAKLPAGVFHDMMRVRLAKLTGHSKSASSYSKARPAPKLDTGRSSPSILRTILKQLILDAWLFADIYPEARASLERESKAGEFCRKLFALFDEKPNISPGRIEEYFRGEVEYSWIRQLNTGENPLTPGQRQEEFLGALNQYMAQARGQRLDSLLSKPLKDLEAHEREELRQLMAQK